MAATVRAGEQFYLQSLEQHQDTVEVRNETGMIVGVGYSNPRITAQFIESWFGVGEVADLQPGERIDVNGQNVVVTSHSVTQGNDSFPTHTVEGIVYPEVEALTPSGISLRSDMPRVEPEEVEELLAEDKAPKATAPATLRRIRLRKRGKVD